MNWFKKKVIKWVREDWENAGNEKRRYKDELVGSSSCRPDIETNAWTDIRVQHVTGGTIVSFTNHRRNDSPQVRYDDYPKSNVYIIQADENLGEAIGKLITTEQLRR